MLLCTVFHHKLSIERTYKLDQELGKVKGKLEFGIFFIKNCDNLSNTRINFCSCKYMIVLKASKISFSINLLGALDLKYQDFCVHLVTLLLELKKDAVCIQGLIKYRD